MFEQKFGIEEAVYVDSHQERLLQRGYRKRHRKTKTASGNHATTLIGSQFYIQVIRASVTEEEAGLERWKRVWVAPPKGERWKWKGLRNQEQSETREQDHRETQWLTQRRNMETPVTKAPRLAWSWPNMAGVWTVRQEHCEESRHHQTPPPLLHCILMKNYIYRDPSIFSARIHILPDLLQTFPFQIWCDFSEV